MAKKNNINLNSAKANKNDEFYTLITDIENELQYYKHHFEGKTVLCNCDDPFESNFFLYFVLNFNHLKLKKLVSTCYQGSTISEQKGLAHGYKIEITEVKDLDGDGMVTNKDIEIMLKLNPPVELEGDGSFESDECVELLKEADIVCTNPPFSRFRDFISLLMEYEKKFLVIGNINAISYKEFFPLIKNNKVWMGMTMNGIGEHWFVVPDNYNKGKIKEIDGIKYATIGSACWFSNLEHKKRHEKLDLYMEYEDNKDYFPKYDNYDAINVNKVIEIPCDYDGVIGVPITFLDKYNPEQFEILNVSAFSDPEYFGCTPLYISGKKKYTRILIKRRKEK